MGKCSILATLLLSLSLIGSSAMAVPKLQTYITGSDYYYNYSGDEDSWVTTSGNFDLKVVGYWDPMVPTTTSGLDSEMLAFRPDYDYMEVYVVVNVPTGQSGTVWINGVEINTFYNYGDAGLASAAPSWYNKTMLPSIHNFNFYRVGEMDNLRANAWHYDEGIIHEQGWGDEALLDVVVRGFEFANFDAIGIDSYGKRYVSPNSHDASYFATPEPGTLSLLGLGLLGIAPLLRRKKNS
ncbi:MAG: choice-of-anchor N protein [Candidatus Krumholzibacteriota bacterium]|nr:choice-of-anchor N protein [Candidatus Krumholzibacteriota bacterium]